jgi:hypothetical protein
VRVCPRLDLVSREDLHMQYMDLGGPSIVRFQNEMVVLLLFRLLSLQVFMPAHCTLPPISPP